MIRKRSFDHKLSDKVKKDVNEYSRMFETKFSDCLSETPYNEIDKAASLGSWQENAVKNKKPRSKSKITQKNKNMTKSKPVAILDTVSGRVVKMYSRVKSAAEAVQILLNMGHRCEWNAGKSGVNLN